MAHWSSYDADGFHSGVREPAPRGGTSRLLIVGALVFVVAVAGAGYVVVDDWSAIFPTTAAPSASPQLANDVASGSPLPSGAAVSSAAATQPPTASVAPADDPAALFAAFIADPNASYHVNTRATAKADGETVTITLSVDESGRNYAGSMTLAAPPKKMSFKLVVKDGMAYAKKGGSGWVATRNLSQLDLPNGGIGFAGVEPDKIDFLGRDAHDGQTLNHLRVLTAPAAGFTSLGSYGCPSRDLPWDIWVRDDGTPVSAQFDYTCTAAGNKLTASATYEFSQVGKQIDIVAPAKFTER